MARESHLPALFQLFRQSGYDGVSLSKIAATTELGKASLYHYFPEGKAEMVSAALAYSSLWMEENVFLVLRSQTPTRARFEQMCDRLNDLHNSGQSPCLLAALTTGAKRDVFQEQVKSHLQKLIDAIAQVLLEAELDPKTAKQRAEEAVITIQGALIVSRGLDNTTVFERAIAHIPSALCAGLSPETTT